MKALYTDGGVIRHNPSSIGGTIAFCLVEDGKIIEVFSDVVLPGQKYTTPNTISNNLTEFLAICHGLMRLPNDWRGFVYSDSLVSIGRANGTFRSFDGIPYDLRVLFSNEKKRLNDFRSIGFTLVGGHPTRNELASGRNKKGCIVSEYNVICDNACQKKAKEYIERNDL